MITAIDRRAPLTVVAFSGIAPQNHVFEWLTALSHLPVNVVGVQDPHDAWWQVDTRKIQGQIQDALTGLGAPRWVAIGGSAGGFGAILYGRLMGADRIVAFVPQSACGGVKRALGDGRWLPYCLGTPDADLAEWGDGVEVHVGDDPLDLKHARRLRGAEMHRYPAIGHDLPHVLKREGLLRPMLEDLVGVGVAA